MMRVTTKIIMDEGAEAWLGNIIQYQSRHIDILQKTHTAAFDQIDICSLDFDEIDLHEMYL